jgi:hypothetical protein
VPIFRKTKTYTDSHLAFQELILSHRILVFLEQEAFFYCRRGLLAERYFYTSDPSESIKWEDTTNISLCGILYQKPVLFKMRPREIADYYQQYAYYHLRLLGIYAGRVLKHEGDILNGFSGLLSAQSHSLGKFHWGLPLRLFPRSLLLHITPGDGLMAEHMSLRPGFPSWSWVGWRYQPASRSYFNGSLNDYWNFQPLVQIYTYDENAHLTLLYGPHTNSKGVEGYCSDAIKKYNELVASNPLPTQPSIKETPPLPPCHMPTSHMLVFWTHVIRLEESECDVKGDVRHDSPEGRECRLKHTDGKYEVILIAMTTPSERVRTGSTNNTSDHKKAVSMSNVVGEKYFGIIIERYRGFARRIGVLARITRKQWLAGNPRKELIILI